MVSALRRHLGAERIKTQPSAYQLHLRPEDRYDVARFEALVADAAGATAAVRAELLREALDLFRGEPFADLDLEIDLHAEAARLDGLRLSAEEARSKPSWSSVDTARSSRGCSDSSPSSHCARACAAS